MSRAASPSRPTKHVVTTIVQDGRALFIGVYMGPPTFHLQFSSFSNLAASKAPLEQYVSMHSPPPVAAAIRLGFCNRCGKGGLQGGPAH